jgi:hypothetical protein
MEPDMASRLDAVPQKRVVGMVATTAGEAASRRRALEIAVQPFNNAAGEGAGLGLRTRQAAVELGDAEGGVVVLRL